MPTPNCGRVQRSGTRSLYRMERKAFKYRMGQASILRVLAGQKILSRSDV